MISSLSRTPLIPSRSRTLFVTLSDTLSVTLSDTLCVTLTKIELHPTDWLLPIDSDDIDEIELAKRVRFESNDMIRFLTRDDREILYQLDPNQLDPNGKNVHYLS